MANQMVVSRRHRMMSPSLRSLLPAPPNSLIPAICKEMELCPSSIPYSTSIIGAYVDIDINIGFLPSKQTTNYFAPPIQSF